MVRLLRAPSSPKISKAEAAGLATMKLEEEGRLGVIDSAAYLFLHKYTIRDYINNGFIQAWLIGSRYYIEQEELERLKALIEVYGSLAKARSIQEKGVDNA